MHKKAHKRYKFGFQKLTISDFLVFVTRTTQPKKT